MKNEESPMPTPKKKSSSKAKVTVKDLKTTKNPVGGKNRKKGF